MTFGRINFFVDNLSYLGLGLLTKNCSMEWAKLKIKIELNGSFLVISYISSIKIILYVFA